MILHVRVAQEVLQHEPSVARVVADSVQAALVTLHLPVRDDELRGQFLLRQTEQDTPLTDAGHEAIRLIRTLRLAPGYAARAEWRRTSHSSYSDNAKTSAPTITKFAWEVGDTMPRV